MSPAENPQPEQLWFSIARLLRPQGRRGEVLAEPLTDLPEVFKPGSEFRLAQSAELANSAPRATLDGCWRPKGRNAGRLVLKLAGIESINAAETLQDLQLFLPETSLPSLEADTYLVRDLLGCRLYDGEALLGTVVDLQFPVGPDGRTRLPDAADLLVVEPSGASPETETFLVPFVKAWLTTTDIEQRRIVMHLPSGLLG